MQSAKPYFSVMKIVVHKGTFKHNYACCQLELEEELEEEDEELLDLDELLLEEESASSNRSPR